MHACWVTLLSIFKLFCHTIYSVEPVSTISHLNYLKAIVDNHQLLFSIIDESNCKTLTKLSIFWTNNVDEVYDAFRNCKLLDTLTLKVTDIDDALRDKGVIDFWANFENLESVDVQLGITQVTQEVLNVKQLWMDLLTVHERLRFIKYVSINRPPGTTSLFALFFLHFCMSIVTRFNCLLGFARISEFIRENLQKAFLKL